MESITHLPRPDAARGAVFGDLFEEIIVRVEEEGKAGREAIHIHAALDAPADILEPVCQRECQLLRGGGACLADVITADRDGVPLRHLLRAVFHGMHYEHHRSRGWEDDLLLGDER